MISLPLLSSEGKNIGEVDVDPKVFDEDLNTHAVHQVLTWYLRSRRAGTHSAKTRGEVSGGGVKPWRQKGTGRARVGSIRSPLWRGGGVIFPPKPRDYSYTLPKKIRKLGIKVVLSERRRAERIKVVEDLKVPKIGTKEMALKLRNLGLGEKPLIIIDKYDENLVKSARNIKGVTIVEAKDLNIHDLLCSEWLLITLGAVKYLEGRLTC